MSICELERYKRLSQIPGRDIDHVHLSSRLSVSQ